MHRFVMALGLTLLASSAALAALPPQYQRQAELLAIIGDSAVIDAFEMEAQEYPPADGEGVPYSP